MLRKISVILFIRKCFEKFRRKSSFFSDDANYAQACNVDKNELVFKKPVIVALRFSKRVFMEHPWMVLPCAVSNPNKIVSTWFLF